MVLKEELNSFSCVPQITKFAARGELKLRDATIEGYLLPYCMDLQSIYNLCIILTCVLVLYSTIDSTLVAEYSSTASKYNA
jgi:hypothetical protein